MGHDAVTHMAQWFSLALLVALLALPSGGARAARDADDGPADGGRGVQIGPTPGDKGKLPPMPPPAPAPALQPGEPHVLLGIFYLNTGTPFGSQDYGLRVPNSFCLNQRATIEAKWKSEGAKSFGDDALWLSERGYAVKLFCIAQKSFDNTRSRNRLLRRPLVVSPSKSSPSKSPPK